MVPSDYLIPYLVSNGIALTILALAFRWPRVVKWIWVVIFVWAALVNSLTALNEPRVYLVYGALTPSETYRDFIYGWFSRYTRQTVLSIALGQVVLAMLLARTGRARRLGAIGAGVFLLAIAPLGVGSAFPFSLTAVFSLLVMEWWADTVVRRQPSPASGFIPRPDATEDHAIDVRAPADLVFDEAKHVDLMADPIVAALIRVRSRVMGDDSRSHTANGLVAETLALGWGVLSYTAGRTLVMGAVARPWEKDVTFSAVGPEGFADFDEPGLVKIVWTLEAEPRGAALTRFRTETRVEATDPAARQKFRWYWLAVVAGIRLIRWRLLHMLRRAAERRHLAESRSAVSPPP